MKPEELMSPWRTGLRWFDERGEPEYGWAIPLALAGGSVVEVLPHFRLKHGMTDEDGRAVQRFHEAAPAMARALLAVYEHDKRFRESPEAPNRSPIESVTAALVLAGVPLP
jgi:hypothetical protein